MLVRLFVTIVWFMGLCLPQIAVADALIGHSAPAFVATTMDGKRFDLSEQKGRVVAVTFWATWCNDCGDELAAIEAVWRRYHSEGFDVVAVSADLPRAKELVKDVAKFFSFPIAMTDGVSKNELLTLTSVPVTVVIGKNGKVHDILSLPMKPLTEAAFGETIKTLLAAKVEENNTPKGDKDEKGKE